MRVLREIRVPGCSRQVPMTVRLVEYIDGQLDDDLCCVDAVWRIETEGSPARFVRLFRGGESLQSLLSKYSFNDSSGCSFSADSKEAAINNMVGNAEQIKVRLNVQRVARVLQARPLQPVYSDRLPPRCRRTVEQFFRRVGMPQPSEFTGLCWWGSALFVAAFPPAMKRLMDHHMQKSDRRMHALFQGVLHSPTHAEELRRLLFYKHRIGDDPKTPPHLQGQNGFIQLARWFSAIGISLTTLYVTRRSPGVVTEAGGGGGTKKKRRTCVLAVRVHRERWQPPWRLRHAGEEWTLQGALLGSEHCEHQCALCRTGKGNTWAFYDSDAVRLGIGPVCFRSKDEQSWYSDLLFTLPYSNHSATSRFCDFSPRNRHSLQVSHDLIRATGGATGGATREMLDHVDLEDSGQRLLNCDWVYTRA